MTGKPAMLWQAETTESALLFTLLSCLTAPVNHLEINFPTQSFGINEHSVFTDDETLVIYSRSGNKTHCAFRRMLTSSIQLLPLFV